MVDNSRILNALSNLRVDTTGLAGEIIDAKQVEHYRSRFAMCLSDQCPEAANAYLVQMGKNASINSSTKLEILHEFQKLTLKEEQ